jgi:hypothetical protein
LLNVNLSLFRIKPIKLKTSIRITIFPPCGTAINETGRAKINKPINALIKDNNLLVTHIYG